MNTKSSLLSIVAVMSLEAWLRTVSNAVKSRDSAGPDPSEYCLVWLLYNSKVISLMLDGYKHSEVSVL